MSNTPSDEELNSVLCHHWPAFSMQAVLVQMWLRDAMRAALAKWGAPQQDVQEPFCYVSVNKQGDITRTMKRKDKWTSIPLYTTPQPAQVQPVVLEPLTDELVIDLAGLAPTRKVCASTCMTRKFDKKPCKCYPGMLATEALEFARAIERAHGITQRGGSNAE